MKGIALGLGYTLSPANLYYSDMSLTHYICCLWPGLPELWFRGRWSGLPSAISFTIAVNFLLVARFVYPQWLEPVVVRLFCWTLVAVWLFVFAKTIRSLPMLLMPREASDCEDYYDSARNEYLKGRYFEAEALLAQCLDTDPRDAAALLMLASVYRQTDRIQAAEMSLSALDTLETGDSWWLEREIESKRLQRTKEELSGSAENADNIDQSP